MVKYVRSPEKDTFFRTKITPLFFMVYAKGTAAITGLHIPVSPAHRITRYPSRVRIRSTCSSQRCSSGIFTSFISRSQMS